MKKRLFISDLDHTLLNSSSEISSENLAAIRRHVEGGGLFTVATGRALAAIKVFPELLCLINLPVITGNGGQVVDLADNDAVIYNRALPIEVCALMEEALVQFPQMGVAAYYQMDGFLSLRTNAYVEELVAREKRTAQPSTVADAYKPWNKVLMIGEHAYMLEVRAWLEPRLAGLGRLVFSETTYLEILPLDVSKGCALQVVLGRAGLDPAEVVAVGDAGNDLEMLQLAGIGAAVSNASPELKAVADVVVCSNDEHSARHCLETFF